MTRFKKYLSTGSFNPAMHCLMFFVAACIVFAAAVPAYAADPSAERKIRQIELYVTTAEYDPIRYEFGLMIAANWKKLGFDVKVTPLEWSRLAQEGIKQKNFDAFTLAWAGRAERIDPDHFCYSVLHSSNVHIGQYNINGYQNPEYDKWAEMQRRIIDPEKRREAVWKCQEIAAKDQPHTPVACRNQLQPYNARDWENWTPMMGEGLQAFWNLMNVKPKTDRKILRWGYPSDVSTMNPLASVATHDFQTFRLIYDRLVRVGVDGKPVNWAAESITQIDDTTIDVKIRSGMKFHDGEPVTVEDVKFSFDFPTTAKSGYFMAIVKPIENVEIVDEQTVRFKLKEPFAPFVANCLGQVFIFPKHIWEKIENPLEYGNENPIGSGPFKLDYWRRNEEIKMSKFEGYFNPPNIDAVIKIPYANVQGMAAGVETGEADFGGWWIEPIQVEQLEKTKHAKVIKVRDHGYYHINYNMRRKPFDDVAVRRAMAYAIPKKMIVERLLEGYGEVTHSIITPPNEFYHNPNVEEFNFSMEKARQELENAGYAWDSKGAIYYPEGKTDDKVLRKGDPVPEKK
jgi:peptide/nickel transport system substrate-binding protein